MSRYRPSRRDTFERGRDNRVVEDRTIFIDRSPPPGPPNAERWKELQRTISPERGISRVFTDQDRLPFDFEELARDRDLSRTRRWELTLREKRGRESGYDQSVVAPLPLVKAHRPRPRDSDREYDRDRTVQFAEEVDPPEQANPREILSKRKIDGIWNPSRNTDLTVTLQLSIQDDLDDSLEEFCRLWRLGNFTAANQFYDDNLEEHAENKPYVLIHYAEMLLQQGDYKTMLEIDEDPIFNPEGNMPDSEEGRLLQMYWELMMLFAKSHKPGASGRQFGAVPAALNALQTLISPEDRNVGSTEIKILALIIRLTRRPHIYLNRVDLHKDIDDAFPPAFYKRLYSSLLRQGRIWDLHDIMMSMVYVSSINDIIENLFDGSDVRNGLRHLISDWKTPVLEYDASTTIALLGILTSLVIEYLYSFKGHDEMVEGFLTQSMPLAMSIMKNDPGNMKSRPYIRWLLAKAQYANEKGPNEVGALVEHLHSSVGVVYHNNRRTLPQYVPAKAENPGWKLTDAAPEYKDPVKLVIDIAKELGDYPTQTLAIQELIRLSSAPASAVLFEDLCQLQQDHADIDSYVDTLVSKYLVSDTEESVKILKEKLSKEVNATGCTDYLNTDLIWVVNMLMYSLEGEGPAAEKALETADDYYVYAYAKLRQEVDKKLPDLKGRARRRKAFGMPTGGAAWHMDPDQVQLDDEQDRLDAEQKILDARQKQLDSRSRKERLYYSDSEASAEDSIDFDLNVKPHLLEGKKVTLSFENIKDPTDRREITYQRDVPAPSAADGDDKATGADGPKEDAPPAHRFDHRRINLRPERDGTGMRENQVIVVPGTRGHYGHRRRPTTSSAEGSPIVVRRRSVSRSRSRGNNPDSDNDSIRIETLTHRSRRRRYYDSREASPSGDEKDRRVEVRIERDTEDYPTGRQRFSPLRFDKRSRSSSVEVRHRDISPPPPPVIIKNRIVEIDSEDNNILSGPDTKPKKDQAGPTVVRVIERERDRGNAGPSVTRTREKVSQRREVSRSIVPVRRDPAFKRRVFGIRIQKAKRLLAIMEDKLTSATQNEDEARIALVSDVLENQKKEIEEMEKQFSEDRFGADSDSASDGPGRRPHARRSSHAPIRGRTRSRSRSRGTSRSESGSRGRGKSQSSNEREVEDQEAWRGYRGVLHDSREVPRDGAEVKATKSTNPKSKDVKKDDKVSSSKSEAPAVSSKGEQKPLEKHGSHRVERANDKKGSSSKSGGGKSTTHETRPIEDDGEPAPLSKKDSKKKKLKKWADDSQLDDLTIPDPPPAAGRKDTDDGWEGFSPDTKKSKKPRKDSSTREKSKTEALAESSSPRKESVRERSSRTDTHSQAASSSEKKDRHSDKKPPELPHALSTVSEEKSEAAGPNLSRDASIEPVTRKPTLPTVESVEDLSEVGRTRVVEEEEVD